MLAIPCSLIENSGGTPFNTRAVLQRSRFKTIPKAPCPYQHHHAGIPGQTGKTGNQGHNQHRYMPHRCTNNTSQAAKVHRGRALPTAPTHQLCRAGLAAEHLCKASPSCRTSCRRQPHQTNQWPAPRLAYMQNFDSKMQHSSSNDISRSTNQPDTPLKNSRGCHSPWFECQISLLSHNYTLALETTCTKTPPWCSCELHA